jgi:hypothetical protein
MKGQNLGTQKQKDTERERERSNLRGPPAPPPPWRPRTRGETLLPSRGEVKEEEEGGGLSPPLSRWCRNAAGAIIVTAIYTNNFAAVITNSLPLYAVVEHLFSPL